MRIRILVAILVIGAMGENGMAQSPVVAHYWESDFDSAFWTSVQSPNWENITLTTKTIELPAGNAVITWNAVVNSTTGGPTQTGLIRPAIGAANPSDDSAEASK